MKPERIQPPALTLPFLKIDLESVGELLEEIKTAGQEVEPVYHALWRVALATETKADDKAFNWLEEKAELLLGPLEKPEPPKSLAGSIVDLMIVISAAGREPGVEILGAA